jgi:Flp pilus assembly protein TadD
MELALILSRDNRNDDAVRMLELDAEFFPQNASVQRQLGETHVARADTAAAIVAFERVMQLQPQNAEVRRRLEQLRK